MAVKTVPVEQAVKCDLCERELPCPYIVEMLKLRSFRVCKECKDRMVQVAYMLEHMDEFI